MLLVGVTGPIGHGKSTLAEFLARQETASVHTESSTIVAEVADRLNKFFVWESPVQSDLNSVNRWLAHLPPIAASVTHHTIPKSKVKLTHAQIESSPADYDKLWEYIQSAHRTPSLLTEHITANNKILYRSFLQWLGGYLVKHVDVGIWYNELVYRAKMAELNGCNLYIVGGLRFPSDADILRAAGGKILRINRPGSAEEDIHDPTERERGSIAADSTIINNGTLENLLHCAAQVYQDIFNGRLQPGYAALPVTQQFTHLK